jgi:hypothetical protein
MAAIHEMLRAWRYMVPSCRARFVCERAPNTSPGSSSQRKLGSSDLNVEKKAKALGPSFRWDDVTGKRHAVRERAT